jgi:hypothetical protein
VADDQNQKQLDLINLAKLRSLGESLSFDDHIQKQLDPINWAKRQALDVFTKIREVIGDEAARRVFKIWSKPPSAAKLRRLEENRIRDAVELFGRTKGEIARELAREKHGKAPTPEQIEDEKRQLRRKLNKPKPRPKAPRRGRTKLS